MLGPCLPGQDPKMFQAGGPGGPGRPKGLLDGAQQDAKKLTATLMRVCVDVSAELDLRQLLKEAAEKDILRWWATLGKYLPPIEQFLVDAVNSSQGVTAEEVVTIMNRIERERQAEAKKIGAEVIE